jgi:hypothetical protein
MANGYRGQSNDMYGQGRGGGYRSSDYDDEDYRYGAQRGRGGWYGSSGRNYDEDEERGYGQPMSNRRGTGGSHNQGGYSTGRESYGSRGYDDDYGSSGQGSRYRGPMRDERYRPEDVRSSNRNYGSGRGYNQGYGSNQNYGSGSRYGSDQNYGSQPHYGSNQNYGSAQGYRSQREYQQPGYANEEGRTYGGQRGHTQNDYDRGQGRRYYGQSDYQGNRGPQDRSDFQSSGRSSSRYSDRDDEDNMNPQIW